MNPVTVQDILEAGKHASLTGNVLTEWAEKGSQPRPRPKREASQHPALPAPAQSLYPL